MTEQTPSKQSLAVTTVDVEDNSPAHESARPSPETTTPVDYNTKSNRELQGYYRDEIADSDLWDALVLKCKRYITDEMLE